MMMISSNRRRPRYRALAAAAVLVLLFGTAVAWRTPLQEQLIRVFTPLLHARFSPGVPAASTEALVADRDALYRENIDLKARLGRPAVPARVLAGVLLRPPATPYDTLTIDAGLQEGVTEGAVVSAGGTTLIGTVSQVFAGSARVTLYSSPGEKYDGLLTLHSGATLPVAVIGQGGGSLSAQVPAGSPVSAGDNVLLPGVFGGLIARVTGVSVGEGQSFTAIYLTLPVNISQLQFVEVLKQ